MLGRVLPVCPPTSAPLRRLLSLHPPCCPMNSDLKPLRWKRNARVHPDSVCTVVSLPIAVGDWIDQQTDVALVEFLETEPPLPTASGSGRMNRPTGQSLRIRGTASGIVNVILVSPGERINVHTDLALLQPCLHLRILSGSCLTCRQWLEPGWLAAHRAEYVPHPSHPHLRVHVSLSALDEESRSISLRRAKRMVLILDIDQTLLHADAKPRSDPAALDRLAAMVDAFNCRHASASASAAASATSACSAFSTGSCCCVEDRIRVFELGNYVFFIKLRPHLTQFLKSCAGKFQMYLFTWGTRPYAEQIQALIDPSGDYFGHRILSKDDCDPLHVEKSLQRIFPSGRHEMVVIVDDTPAMWHFNQHVVPIPRFVFWPWVELAEPDDWLLKTHRVLQRVHGAFFSAADEESPHASIVVPSMLFTDIMRRPLTGCVLGFSGLFPSDVQVETTFWYRLAAALGATVADPVLLPSLDAHDDAGNNNDKADGQIFLTHLVCRSAASDLPRRASKTPGLFLVREQWLSDCWRLEQRMPELPYSIWRSDVAEDPSPFCRPAMDVMGENYHRAVSSLHSWRLLLLHESRPGGR